MRAVVYERYGPPEVLELREVDTPVRGDGDVLIRVMAASVNRSDWETLTGKPLYARIGGLLRPRHQILGSDIAGRVEAVGKSVESFRPGDEVFGDVMYHGASGFAEYVRVQQSAPLVHKPAGISFAEASTLPQAGVIALQGIEGNVEAGSRILINGAGGGAGGFAVQMAKAAGAEVTAVDNRHKQDFLRSLGADHVLDYTQTDYTKTARTYDLILDLVCERSIFAIRRAVAPGGRYLVVGGSVRALLSASRWESCSPPAGAGSGCSWCDPTRTTSLDWPKWSLPVSFAPPSIELIRWQRCRKPSAASGRVAPWESS